MKSWSSSFCLLEDFLSEIDGFLSWARWFFCQPWVLLDLSCSDPLFRVDWEHSCEQILEGCWEIVIVFLGEMIPISFSVAFEKMSEIWVSSDCLEEGRDTINHTEQNNTECENINLFSIVFEFCLDFRGHVSFSTHNSLKFAVFIHNRCKSKVGKFQGIIVSD